MNAKQLIPATTLCAHYNIEISFVAALNTMGLIQMELIEKKYYVPQDEIGHFEKIIRLHNELDINLEGIDVVLNLLEKEKALRNELNLLRKRLRLYENN